ncbi:MAG: peptidoglycan DD-metalloendopeptidase family protein [Geminicoccaceae bacterium]
MEADALPARWWRTGVALIAVGITASCSIYRPLDQGSRVPWAQDRAAAQGGISASGAEDVALSEERYRVRRGDRLGDLARSYGVTVAAFAQANDLGPPYIIRVDQELRIPARASAAPAPTVLASRTVRPQRIGSIEVAPPQPRDHGTAQVRPGPQEVAALEEAAPPPGPRPTPELKPAPTASIEPGAGPATDRHTVRSGETLSGIARRHDIGVTELAQANDIGRPYRVYAGQKLRIPGADAPQTATVELGHSQGSVRLATGAPPPLDGDDFLWPVNGKVIGAFGPIDQWRRRDGIDIAARRGAPVLAAQDGIVAYAGDGIPGYGEMILLRHDQGYITTYAHNATLLVEVGDVVQRGQVIARVGDTGDATQSMLHFELRKGRTPIDPQTRLVNNTTELATNIE